MPPWHPSTQLLRLPLSILEPSLLFPTWSHDFRLRINRDQPRHMSVQALLLSTGPVCQQLCPRTYLSFTNPRSFLLSTTHSSVCLVWNAGECSWSSDLTVLCHQIVKASLAQRRSFSYHRDEQLKFCPPLESSSWVAIGWFPLHVSLNRLQYFPWTFVFVRVALSLWYNVISETCIVPRLPCLMKASPISRLNLLSCSHACRSN